MKRSVALCALLLLLVDTRTAFADAAEVGGDQNRFEKDIGAVVRDKQKFKGGKIELGLSAGLMPYDSLYNQYIASGRLSWHISDHYGWEILDFAQVFSSATEYTTSLASSQSMDVRDLQGISAKQIIGTSFLVSPFYGKIRFFGKQVVYLDIYLAMGIGMVKTETQKYTHVDPSTFTVSTVASAWDPSLNYGAGFKFFLGGAFTLFFDLRNYMSYSQSYGGKGFHSNFIVTGGLSLFLPGFG